MSKPTATYLLLEARLGEDLEAYVANLRGQTPKASWMRIAHDLGKRTDIVVTPETLRSWFVAAELAPEPVAS